VFARSLRNLGSAALHMCFVAAGKLDAHFTYGIHIWDMAAGDLIVREAGGIVCDTSGNCLACCIVPKHKRFSSRGIKFAG